MRSLLFFVAFFVCQVFAGCPAVTSIYNPGKVNCPKCTFLPAGIALKQSGTKATFACPKGYEVWFYNQKGQEFVAPSAAIKSNQLSCSGSNWIFKPAGADVKLTAIACAKE